MVFVAFLFDLGFRLARAILPVAVVFVPAIAQTKKGEEAFSFADPTSTRTAEGYQEYLDKLDSFDNIRFRTRHFRPLALDLDADGVIDHLYRNNIITFDYFGDGFAEQSTWINEKDAFLAIDRNSNGSIDNLHELIGPHVAQDVSSGFMQESRRELLAELDSNNDGVVDSSDAIWGSLRLYRWKDINGPYYNQKVEHWLESLDQHDIVSLDFGAMAPIAEVEFWDRSWPMGVYTKVDGATGDMAKALTRRTPFRTTYVGPPEVLEYPETIAALPDAVGYLWRLGGAERYCLVVCGVGAGDDDARIAQRGMVHSLRYAMTLDDAGLLQPPFYGAERKEQRTLSQMVATFVATTDMAEKDELLEKILLRWTGAEAAGEGGQWDDLGHWDDSYLAYTSPQKLAVVEAFRGDQWKGRGGGHPDKSAFQKINDDYNYRYEKLRAQLLGQTTLRDMFDAVRIVHDGRKMPLDTDLKDLLDDVEIEELELDFSGVLAVENAAALKGDFLRSAAVLFPSHYSYRTEIDAPSEWVYEYHYLQDYYRTKVSDDFTEQGNDLVGKDYKNTFRTTDGQSDILRGEGCWDVYQLVPGTGHDNVYEVDCGISILKVWDAVKVAPGVTPSDVTLSREGNDLVVGLMNDEGRVNDSMRFRGHYEHAGAKLEKIEFSDGTKWGAIRFMSLSLGQWARTLLASTDANANGG